ncbi:hypothetical protein N7537_012068 [Penicillium hordei]|jgi:hypothetical protein|uniref:Uncharacterized protein n=1 Tax=Penicillium hordei TaxID=40994 RepID=A0AAD6DNS5_9EURO|nr:uncharacterized protein N7537_012068 [Penicillium hordei]KAJ5589390.1 hypothetical protein N7537_012068 [Penicillium hordei]
MKSAFEESSEPSLLLLITTLDGAGFGLCRELRSRRRRARMTTGPAELSVGGGLCPAVKTVIPMPVDSFCLFGEAKEGFSSS